MMLILKIKEVAHFSCFAAASQLRETNRHKTKMTMMKAAVFAAVAKTAWQCLRRSLKSREN